LASATWKRADLARGVEPDTCYYLASFSAVCDKQEIDLETDPPPDLACEIDLSSSSLDRLAIYAALGVPEVWRFDGEALHVHRLGRRGAYSAAKASKALPGLPPAVVERFLADASTNDTAWAAEFRRWLGSS
jgi:Uma2 family endonuclease